MCNHPFLSYPPPYAGFDPVLLVRRCGKFALLDRVLVKLHATGESLIRPRPPSLPLHSKVSWPPVSSAVWCASRCAPRLVCSPILAGGMHAVRRCDPMHAPLLHRLYLFCFFCTSPAEDSHSTGEQAAAACWGAHAESAAAAGQGAACCCHCCCYTAHAQECSCGCWAGHRVLLFLLLERAC